MIGLKFTLRWGWFLGLALMAPVGLPAGGAIFECPLIRRREVNSPFFAGKHCFLRSSPIQVAPVLSQIPLGSPVKVLRIWKSDSGEDWLQVQANNISSIGFQTFNIRGWVRK